MGRSLAEACTAYTAIRLEHLKSIVNLFAISFSYGLLRRRQLQMLQGTQE
jgi:hypothetical protein